MPIILMFHFAGPDQKFRIPLPSSKMDVGERLRATIARFGQFAPPVLMGSGFCIDGSRRIFCSCAHVWRDIQSETPRARRMQNGPRTRRTWRRHWRRTRRWKRGHGKEAEAAQKDGGHGGEEGGEDGGHGNTRSLQARRRSAFSRPTSNARRTARSTGSGGPCCLTRPACSTTPNPVLPDGLDLVIVQLTQHDGEPLASLVPLVALPLGRADTLVDPLTMLGFGVPRLKPGFGARPRQYAPEGPELLNHRAPWRLGAVDRNGRHACMVGTAAGRRSGLAATSWDGTCALPASISCGPSTCGSRRR